MNIYVGNLSYSLSESELRDAFADFGEVSSVKVLMDRETGRSKGFAFITFATQQAAESALEKNGQDCNGRALRVNIAQEKGGGRGGRRGGGGGGGGGRW